MESKMIYVGKRFDGSIYGVWRNKQLDDASHPNMSQMEENDPAVLAFVARPPIVVADPRDTQIAALEARLALVEEKLVAPKEEGAPL
jgi:hypothetical protein